MPHGRAAESQGARLTAPRARAACAAAGDADAAFRLYAELRAGGVPTEAKVYAALISACNQEALAAGGGHGRRQSLVLLERAAGVLGDMRAARVRPDRAVWNAFITAAGRAGQLQRAFQALEEMQARARARAPPAAPRRGRAPRALLARA